jgi:hypothetical protein
MDELSTAFAPAERASAKQLASEHQELLDNPAARVLLDGFPEPAAILNRQRQIVLANKRLAEALGKPAEALIGLRPGEALNCIHWTAGKGGCGTSEECRLCGAVNAIVNSQNTSAQAVQECRITSSTPAGETCFDFLAVASPLELSAPFTVFACRDISDEKRRQVLERTFFHDALNSAGGLQGLLEILPRVPSHKTAEILTMAVHAARELVEEIQAGRDLALAERGALEVRNCELRVPELLDQVRSAYRFHSLGVGKEIVIGAVTGPTTIWSDETLLRRILGSLTKNALEASTSGETVTLSFENEVVPTFSVQNPAVIPEDVKRQIFQRSFSTRSGTGRGVGTYSIRLLTEKYLGGKVEFTSTVTGGTTFRVRVPSGPAL